MTRFTAPGVYFTLTSLLAWLCLGEVHICIWPSSFHCHSLSLAPVNPDWYVYLPGFTFLVLAHPGSPVQNPEGRKTVVVVVVVVCIEVVVLYIQRE